MASSSPLPTFSFIPQALRLFDLPTRYKLTIAYDGTPYCGWQVQENGLSIQSLIQKALQTVLRHPLDLTGSGRTDAGVHARGQTAHFDTPTPLIPLASAISSMPSSPPTFGS